MDQNYFLIYEKDKIKKLKNRSEEDRFKLVYKWVKTGTINLKLYMFLMDLLKNELKKEIPHASNAFDDNKFYLEQRIESLDL